MKGSIQIVIQMPLCDSQVTSTGNAQQFTGLIILLLDELDELIVTMNKTRVSHL